MAATVLGRKPEPGESNGRAVAAACATRETSRRREVSAKARRQPKPTSGRGDNRRPFAIVASVRPVLEKGLGSKPFLTSPAAEPLQKLKRFRFARRIILSRSRACSSGGYWSQAPPTKLSPCLALATSMNCFIVSAASL
jgi:hypothetical protein